MAALKSRPREIPPVLRIPQLTTQDPPSQLGGRSSPFGRWKAETKGSYTFLGSILKTQSVSQEKYGMRRDQDRCKRGVNLNCTVPLQQCRNPLYHYLYRIRMSPFDIFACAFRSGLSNILTVHNHEIHVSLRACHSDCLSIYIYIYIYITVLFCSSYNASIIQ